MGRGRLSLDGDMRHVREVGIKGPIKGDSRLVEAWCRAKDAEARMTEVQRGSEGET